MNLPESGRSIGVEVPPAQDETLVAEDGVSLATTWFQPPADALDATLIIGGATAVRRQYYGAFARVMASRGFRVVTLDYRGIGGSAPGRLRGFRATMQDWATLDLERVFDAVEQRAPGRPVVYVAHSFGGQAVGLLRHRTALRAAVFVASQSGYWRHWPGLAKLGMLAFWSIVIPGTTRLLGYFPSRRLGMGENLPAGVAGQWARWGRHRDYILSAAPDAPRRFAEFTAPIRAYSLADDGYAPRRAVEALLEAYGGAAVEHRHVSPADVGASRIGHFGFFRKRFEDTLWSEVGDWLQAEIGTRGAVDP